MKNDKEVIPLTLETISMLKERITQDIINDDFLDIINIDYSKLPELTKEEYLNLGMEIIGECESIKIIKGVLCNPLTVLYERLDKLQKQLESDSTSD